ncbi:MAG: hypothetical protein AAB757_01850 [Patescibacteria group bacterium]
MKNWLKENWFRVTITLILFLGIMAFLDEFYYIRDQFNHYLIGLLLTFLVVFVWKNIIKKVLNKWF